MDCRMLYDSFGFMDNASERELGRFEKTLPYVISEGSLYDAGCGEGFWLSYLADRKSLDLTGSDVSPVRLEKAKRVLDGKNVRLVVNDLRNLPYRDGEFDQVTSMEVLEHIPEWKDALGELVRVASKSVVITVPYSDSLLKKKCPQCGGDAYLSGHVNSFTEKDFGSAGIQGSVSYSHFYKDRWISYYSGKLLEKLGEKISGAGKSQPFTHGGHMHFMVCQDCYDPVPYTPSVGRRARNIARSIAGVPEFLLVKIDK